MLGRWKSSSGEEPTGEDTAQLDITNMDAISEKVNQPATDRRVLLSALAVTFKDIP
jgi:hypothetical protein